MNGYEAYCLFMAIKLHFQSESYNAFKYNFKLKSCTPENYDVVKGKFYYEKLARRYQTREVLMDFLVGNFIEEPSKSWFISDFLDGAAIANYKKFQQRIESIHYIFKEDLVKIFDYVSDELDSDADSFFQSCDSWDWLFSNIRVETIVLLNGFMHFLERWEKEIDDDILFPTFYNLVMKYSPFVRKVGPEQDRLEQIMIEETKRRMS